MTEFYFTGRPCLQGHLAQRYVSDRICVECKKLKNQNDRQNNPRLRETIARWHREHRADHRLHNKKWYDNNQEKVKGLNAVYKKANRGKANAWNRKRKLRTPSWANLKKIERAYQLAAWASRFTDEPLHIDHIIPLQGAEISGLHVENNLQILPRSKNLDKSNEFIPAN